MNRNANVSRRAQGKAGEKVAADYLRKNGYIILEQNYYYRRGEIDIVAMEGETLVFVEVKMRRSNRFGEPIEAVTPRKQDLLRRTAEGYVAERKIENRDCRFDVVSILLREGNTECTLYRDCL